MTDARTAAALAALIAAFGVAGAAAGAHVPGGALLVNASAILLFEAPMLLAAAAALHAGLLGGRLAPFALALTALGAVLFAGDLAMRVFTGDKLFAMAAPTGGWLMIGGWLLVAFAVLIGGAKRDDGTGKT
jgi:uncharacterized membrane protein YgdD (TMEM256/DUF423 family)